MHSTVSTNDEAHFDFSGRGRGGEQRIWSGQSLWWLDVSASRARADMRYIDILRSTPQSQWDLSLAVIDGGYSRRGGRSYAGESGYARS